MSLVSVGHCGTSGQSASCLAFLMGNLKFLPGTRVYTRVQNHGQRLPSAQVTNLDRSTVATVLSVKL